MESETWSNAMRNKAGKISPGKKEEAVEPELSFASWPFHLH